MKKNILAVTIIFSLCTIFAIAIWSTPMTINLPKNKENKLENLEITYYFENVRIHRLLANESLGGRNFTEIMLEDGRELEFEGWEAYTTLMTNDVILIENDCTWIWETLKITVFRDNIFFGEFEWGVW